MPDERVEFFGNASTIQCDIDRWNDANPDVCVIRSKIKMFSDEVVEMTIFFVKKASDVLHKNNVSQ